MSIIATAQPETVIEGRATTYRLLAGLLARELTAQDVGALSALAGRSDPETATEATDGLGSALARLIAALPAAGDVETLLDLAAEYARLFLGAAGPPVAPPYESFYRGEERLYGRASLEVRALLDRWAVAWPATLGPEDHAACELLLMAALAERSRGADADAAVSLLACQIQLLHERLLEWIPAFAARVQAQAPDTFYAILLQVIDRFLCGDYEYLRATSAD